MAGKKKECAAKIESIAEDCAPGGSSIEGAAPGDFTALGAAALDAERSIEICLRQMSKGEEVKLDLRAFSMAVSTLRRLIDARAALQGYLGAAQDTDAAAAELEQALKQFEGRRGGANADDIDADDAL